MRYAILESSFERTAHQSALCRQDPAHGVACPDPGLSPLLGTRVIFDGWAGWFYVLQRTPAETMIAIELADRRLRGTSSENVPAAVTQPPPRQERKMMDSDLPRIGALGGISVCATLPMNKPQVRLRDFSNASFSRGRPKIIEAFWILASALLIASSVAGSAHRRVISTPVWRANWKSRRDQTQGPHQVSVAASGWRRQLDRRGRLD